MLPAFAARTEFPVESLEAAQGRAEVLSRFEHLRAIGRRQLSGALGFLSEDALASQARRLPLKMGHLALLDHVDVRNFVFDLAIHTAEMGRSRAIDRYARAVRVRAGSDEALVLAALCRARFTIFRLLRNHQLAGWMVEDVLRTGEFWIIDETLNISDGPVFAGRLYRPEGFSIRAGPRVACEPEFLSEVAEKIPQLRRKSLQEVADDRRFAQALYGLTLDRLLVDELDDLDFD